MNEDFKAVLEFKYRFLDPDAGPVSKIEYNGFSSAYEYQKHTLDLLKKIVKDPQKFVTSIEVKHYLGYFITPISLNELFPSKLECIVAEEVDCEKYDEILSLLGHNRGMMRGDIYPHTFVQIHQRFFEKAFEFVTNYEETNGIEFGKIKKIKFNGKVDDLCALFKKMKDCEVLDNTNEEMSIVLHKLFMTKGSENLGQRSVLNKLKGTQQTFDLPFQEKIKKLKNSLTS